MIAWWPVVHCFVCYPMAGMFGQVSSILYVSLFLSLNTVCYVTIGAVTGILFEAPPLGMCLSTIISQTSMVAAGFYTELPVAIGWMRYLSPVFWSYRGMLKTMFKWSDTFTCVKGDSAVGINQCYLEFHPIIDNLKIRDINVATFNDEESGNVFVEGVLLCLLFVAFQTMIYLLTRFKINMRNSLLFM